MAATKGRKASTKNPKPRKDGRRPASKAAHGGVEKSSGRGNGQGKGKQKAHTGHSRRQLSSVGNDELSSRGVGPKSKTTIPFKPHDRILLVGEGDFSFARSLVDHHACADLTATSLDSAADLFSKYPQSSATIAYLQHEVDQKVFHDIDATRLATHAKQLKWNPRTFERIVFNFPHVGGKSKDVNRQVRFNQELLVKFLKEAASLLAPWSYEDHVLGGGDGGDEGGEAHPPSVLVTLFEAHPYTLWNVRDLARHVGLRVLRSFRFDAGAYPGYRHARTLGNLRAAASRKWGDGMDEGGEDGVGEDDDATEEGLEKGESIDGKMRPGAWHGEQRSARTYEFITEQADRQLWKAQRRRKVDSDSD